MKQFSAINSTKKRLDKFVSEHADISRSRAAQLIKDGHVLINSRSEKSSYLIKKDDMVEVNIPEVIPIGLIPQNIDIDIIYEDEDIIIINKARGMVVHPSVGHEDKTLVNALLYHCKDLKGVGGELRPGIVHRIDKDTTGLLMVAKNDDAMKSLSKQLAQKTAQRKYKALVLGIVKNDGFVDAPIMRSRKDRKKMAVHEDGRNAKTLYKVEKSFLNNTLLDISLTTGRTHQIRVHMAHISHPVVGDVLYGVRKKKFKLDGQLLHAYSLSFIHPRTLEPVCFFAPLPYDFERILSIIK